jgi:spore germination protein
MEIYVVKPGDTLYQIALNYGVSMDRLLGDNQLPDPSHLVVGQTLVIQFPALTHTVQAGDTLSSIAAMHQTTVRQLLRNNPMLQGGDRIFPGQVLVVQFQQEKQGTLCVNGYAYPSIDRGLLQGTLPYLSQLTPFTYGFTPQGTLVIPDDKNLLDAAQSGGVQPILHLSTLTEAGTFSNDLARVVLNDQTTQEKLLSELLLVMEQKGYQGLDVDFEYVSGDDAAAYARWIDRLRQALSPLGLPVSVALAPKTSADQPGLLYEGHNYRLLGQAADYVLLMTYEWGYTYGPPMAVAPIQNVRRVVEYALREIPAEKIFLGIPNYGYDWTLPFQKGSKATSISNLYAVTLAWQNGAAIRYDEAAQSPWFRYVDAQGREHEVWFEDARSIAAKLSLAQEKGLYGVSVWNLDRPFPQNWLVLNSLYNIREASGFFRRDIVQ